MYTIDEVIEMIMDEPCNDLTIGDCFDEEEITTIINNLTESNIVGELNDDGGDVYDDGDIDTIIDNLN